MNQKPFSGSGDGADGQDLRPLDLSSVVKRTRNMLNPEIVFRWNSYTGQFTALGAQLLSQISVSNGKCGEHPGVLHLSEWQKGSPDVLATPMLERGNSTVLVKWPEKEGQPRVNMQKFFLLQQFTIPHGHRAYVPIVAKPAGSGQGLLFAFSQARVAPIETGKNTRSRKGSKSGTSQAQGTQGNAAPQAPATQAGPQGVPAAELDGEQPKKPPAAS